MYELATSFSLFESLDFQGKLCFVKPIAYKLLYLHHSFRTGLQNFKLMKATPEAEWKIIEESDRGIRDMKIFIDDLHVMTVFEMPASEYENVVSDWPRAFKLWAQGNVVSKLFTGDKESTLHGEQCLDDKQNSPEIPSKVTNSFDGNAASVFSSEGEEEDSDLIVLRDSTSWSSDHIFDRILRGALPETKERAEEYCRIYEKEGDDSIGFRSGVLVLRYFLNNINDCEEDARQLLGTLIE
jgi:hypothetical protein